MTVEQVESKLIIIPLILSFEWLLLFVSFVYHLPLYLCVLDWSRNNLILTVSNFCRETVKLNHAIAAGKRVDALTSVPSKMFGWN